MPRKGKFGLEDDVFDDEGRASGVKGSLKARKLSRREKRRMERRKKKQQPVKKEKVEEKGKVVLGKKRNRTSSEEEPSRETRRVRFAPDTASPPPSSSAPQPVDPEDAEIAHLERMLGVGSLEEGLEEEADTVAAKKRARKRRKLTREYAMDGWGADMLDFLEELPRVGSGKAFQDGRGGRALGVGESLLGEEIVPLVSHRPEWRIGEEEGEEEEVGLPDSDEEMKEEEEGEEEGEEEEEEEEEEVDEKVREAEERRKLRATQLYGAKGSKDEEDGKEKSAYVPPAMRGGVGGSGSAALEGIRRRVRGLLNRVTVETVEPVVKQLRGLYKTAPSAEVSAVLAESLLSACESEAQITQSLLMAQTAVVAGLHIVIGTSPAAVVMERVAEVVRSSILSPKPTSSTPLPPQSHRINALLALCFLFLFEITDASLLAEVLSTLARRFEDDDIQLLLAALRHVGSRLRSEAPEALRAIIEAANSATSSSSTSTKSIRAQVLLDLLRDLRNNHQRAGQKRAGERGEIVRKWIGDFAKRSGKAGVDRRLCVKWDDLAAIRERGRWWVVGASWKGRADEKVEKGMRSGGKGGSGGGEGMGGLLEEKAKKLRMNTEVRRQVFEALMGAKGVDDAVARLMGLKLRGPSEREIPRVILDCAGQEKRFNLFYAAVIARLCELRAPMRFTTQLSLWDQLKVMAEYSQRRQYNLAKTTANLILRNTLSISALKIFDLSRITPHTLLFLRACIGTILTDADSEKALETIFRRLGSGTDRPILRDGLVVFLKEHMPAHAAALAGDDKMVRKALRKRISVASNAVETAPDEYAPGTAPREEDEVFGMD